MGGKSSQSQSTVTIPPEVLARYNAVNQRADEVTNRPYQNYSGQFVAPVNEQQQQGIAGVNAAANQAQPYYGAATGQLTQAQNAAQGYNRAATGNIYGAQNVGNAYANQSSQSLQGAGQAAAGLQGQAAQAYGSAYGNAQGYNNTAGAQYAGAQGAAQPLQNQAAQNITNAQNVGGSMTQNAYSTLQGAGQSAQPLQNQAAQGYQQAYANAQGYNNQATGMYGSAMQSAQPLNQQAAQNIAGGQAIGSDFARQAAGSLQGAGQSAAGLQDQAAQAYGNANMAGQAGGLAAANLYNQSLNQSQGYNQAAGQNIYGAQAAANPLNQAAVGLAGAATQAVNASPLDTNSINQYMSPYLQNVVGSQAQLLNQNNQQAMAGQLGNAVRSGAFGGDRAGIVAANLNQQQQLANANIYSNLLNQGYNTALQTAQQQQGVNLGAGQANRAALMAGSQQIGALGQQQFGQGMSAAQQQAALGQQVYGQQAGAGQNFAALGQQQFGQGLAGGQAQAALGQQQYAQGANTAAQQAALGQQQFGQNLSAAQQQAALGQQQFGQATTTGQNLAAIGQQQFNQGSTTAQNQAALGQQQYAQGANTAAQQAAMGQQLYGQGMGAAQQQAALGQQQFGQANTTGQNMAALGQQQFGQGLAAGQAQQSLGQQQYAQGANTAAQQAALGQQQFGQGMTASQQQAAIGQQVYGQGANTSNALANLGLGAQNAALQGAQAQIGAGTLQQQTQQAQNQALYNQFLQAQSLPYQQLAQQAAIAEGTGSLSGSTTTGTAPGGFFSDERLKQDIEPVGKTFDGQTVYKYRYKGDPKDKTQIGLIAQDVEHKHPSAVGLADGYKTVNYDKATHAAADRGHFYAGGLAAESMGGHVDSSHLGEGYAYGGVPDGSTPVAPGLSGADMAALIQAQSAMYAPGHGGLYGAAPGGAPYGGTQIVPAQTNATPHMMTPGELPKYSSPAEHAKNFAESAEKFAKLADSDSGKWAVNKAKSLWKKDKTTDEQTLIDELGNKAYGGAIGHYADGGLAGAEDKNHVTDKTSLDIPVPSASYKLQAPELPPQGKSGMSDVADIAKIAAMFMAAANGGRINRHHYAAGGDLPYSSTPSNGVDVPVPSAGGKLEAPALPTAPPSGLSQLADLASSVTSIAGAGKTFGLGKAHGGGLAGRHGYALDGSVEGRFYDNPDDPEVIRQRAAEVRARTPSQAYGTQTVNPASAEAGVAGGQAEAAAARAGAGGGSGLINRGLTAAANAVPEWLTTAGRLASKGLGVASLALTPNESIASQTEEDIRMGRNIDPVTGKLMGLRPNPTVAPPSVVSAKPMQAVRQAAQKPAPAPAKPGVTITPQDQQLAMNLPADAAAPAGGLAPPVQGALTPGSESNVSMQNYLNNMPVEVGAKPPAGGLAPPAAPPAAGKPSMIDKLKSSLLQNEKGEYDSSKIIPLLTGIAAMGTAPTRSLGTALATGVGAGAQAYLPTKQKIADIQQTNVATDRIVAQTGIDRAQAADAWQQIMKNGVYTINKVPHVMLYSGQLIPYSDWAKDKNRPPVIGQSQLFGAVNDPANPVAQIPKQNASVSGSSLATPMTNITDKEYAPVRDVVNQVNSGMISPEVLQQRNSKIQSEMADSANIAATSRQNMSDLAKAISIIPASSPLSGGPMQPILKSIVTSWNQAMRLAGAPESATFSDQDITPALIRDKIANGQAFANASAAGQHSLQSLQEAMAVSPSGDIPRDAALHLTARMMINNQRMIDLNNFEREMRTRVANDGIGYAYDAEAARTSFNNSRSQSYASDIDALSTLLSNNQLMDDVLSGKRTPAEVDKMLGVKGITRYLLGK